MTSGERNPFNPADLAELRAITRADVIHLRSTWTATMDFHALRRDAVVIRRLLVDNGGDLARLWRAEERDGQLLIPNVSDLRRFPHWKGLGFGTAHPVEAGTTVVSDLLMWRLPELNAPEIQAALEASKSPDPNLTIPAFRDSVCLVSNEQPVRRVDLVTYIANRRGGAHSDRRRVPGDPRRRAAWAVLDDLCEQNYQVNQRDAAFGQLVTIGRAVVDSPDVQALISQ